MKVPWFRALWKLERWQGKSNVGFKSSDSSELVFDQSSLSTYILLPIGEWKPLLHGVVLLGARDVARLHNDINFASSSNKSASATRLLTSLIPERMFSASWKYPNSLQLHYSLPSLLYIIATKRSSSIRSLRCETTLQHGGSDKREPEA
jgi:hypothetical protein